MMGEAGFDELQDFAGDGIGGKGGWRWDAAGALFGEGLAVVGVIVPFATGRLAVVHKDIVAAAHFPIEELHAELLAGAGVPIELGGGREEVAVLEDFESGADGEQ